MVGFKTSNYELGGVDTNVVEHYGSGQSRTDVPPTTKVKPLRFLVVILVLVVLIEVVWFFCCCCSCCVALYIVDWNG
jgi:hypothetical protein